MDELWNETSRNNHCKNRVKDPQPTPNDVTNQLECQQKCTENSKCLGISYSHKEGNSGYCYICLDQNLSPAYNGFGFYRRPSSFKPIT